MLLEFENQVWKWISEINCALIELFLLDVSSKCTLYCIVNVNFAYDAQGSTVGKCKPWNFYMYAMLGYSSESWSTYFKGFPHFYVVIL